MFNKRWLATGVALFLCILVCVGSVSASILMIDDFVTVQNAEVDLEAPPVQWTGSSLNTASAIGIERDLYAEKTLGSDGERIRARVNPNGEDLFRQSIDDARGRVVLTWDGVDGLYGPDQVSYGGLGGVDLTQFLHLDLMVAFSDVGGPVNFTFWDASDLSGNTYARTTFNVPGNLPPGSMEMYSKTFLDPSAFVATGGSLADIFANVGAIQMEIDSRAAAQEGWDAQFDFVRASGEPTTPVPEPSAVLLLGAGLAALTYQARRPRRRHLPWESVRSMERAAFRCESAEALHREPEQDRGHAGRH